MILKLFAKINKKSKGAMSVEILLFLLPVIFALGTVINMARTVQAEMIIHHAITQTAKEISAYGYILTRTGISERIQNSNKKSAGFKKDVDGVVTSVEDFASSFSTMNFSTISEKGQAATSNVQSFVSDPEAIFQGIISCFKSGLEKTATTYLVGNLARGSIQKQISLMNKDVDAYLENLGVVDGIEGLDFSKSEWITNESGKANVSVVVTFKMKNNMFPMFDFGERDYVLSANTLSW